MKRLTFNIRTNAGKLEQRHGYKVDLPEFPRLSLAIHNDRFWIVTELKTGGIFCFGAIRESRRDCLQRIKARIEKIGIEEILELITLYDGLCGGVAN